MVWFNPNPTPKTTADHRFSDFSNTLDFLTDQEVRRERQVSPGMDQAVHRTVILPGVSWGRIHFLLYFFLDSQ